MCTVLFQCVLKTKTFNPRKFSLQSARDELIFFFFFTVYVMELFSTFTEQNPRELEFEGKETHFLAAYIYVYMYNYIYFFK